MLLKKTILGLLIVSIAAYAAVGYINIRVPYAKSLVLHIDDVSNGMVTVSGSVDIKYKNPKAWTEFGYKDGNFYYFSKYWEDQVGNEFSYAGITVRLEGININLDQHTQSYDHLTFTILLRPV